MSTVLIFSIFAAFVDALLPVVLIAFSRALNLAALFAAAVLLALALTIINDRLDITDDYLPPVPRLPALTGQLAGVSAPALFAE